MKKTTILFSALSLIIVSCSLFNGDDDLPTGTYEGFYTWGFETNKFQPCLDINESWLVKADNPADRDSLLSKYQSIADENYEKVFVRLVGDPSKKGEYGHMGSSDRMFALQEIVEIREAKPSDCK